MAFVNEIIPEEQKENFNFPVQISRSGRKPTLFKWVIDSENGYYLVMASSKGGAYEGTREQNTFYFHVGNVDIHIEASPWGKEYTEDKHMIYRWKITRLVFPGYMRDQAENIVELVVQAFKIWGHLNDGDSYYRVEVDILCDITFNSDKDGK